MSVGKLERLQYVKSKQELEKYRLKWNIFNWVDMGIFAVAFVLAYFLLR